jgi:hypothetical protein
MRLGAMTRIGLKSPNSLSHDIPSVLRRTVNVSQRVQGVSIFPECVRVGLRLQGPVPAVVIQCAFGLSPKFSTPVEKTVENRIKPRFRSMFVG